MHVYTCMVVHLSMKRRDVLRRCGLTSSFSARVFWRGTSCTRPHNHCFDVFCMCVCVIAYIHTHKFLHTRGVYCVFLMYTTKRVLNRDAYVWEKYVHALV